MKTTKLNYEKWHSHFELNRCNRPEPDWSAPRTISPHILPSLLRSIEEFQLGDGGGPASLIAFDAEQFHGRSAEIRGIVDAWFTEEREHSRLLACAVARL